MYHGYAPKKRIKASQRKITHRWPDLPPPDDTARTWPKVRPKTLRYGPERMSEYSWERDVRLSGRAVTQRAYEQRASPEEMDRNLFVENVQLHIDRKTFEHHTDKFICTKERQDPDATENILEPELVVRRGQPFTVTLTLNETFDRGMHDLQLGFSILGFDFPDPKAGTWIFLDIKDEYDKFQRAHNWRVYLLSTSYKTVNIEVTPPSSCIVNEWVMSVYTQSLVGMPKKPVLRYEYPADITILFNPWCKIDPVYQDAVICAETEVRGFTNPLEEYILNDCGVIYLGSPTQIVPKPWHYGQFDEGVLKVALHLVRKTFLYEVSGELANPILVARGLTQIISATSGGGVIQEEIIFQHDGIRGAAWIGSPKILQTYEEKNGKPVKYGRDWVLAAVYTTVCRAIGIPCRTVTSYNCHHDATGKPSVFIGYGPNQDGDLERILSPEKFWYLHAWNEVWMSRQDLLNGYSGWQVMDPTPQVIGRGIYSCGPAPVKAIKSGTIDLMYDIGFVYSEVNADRDLWDWHGGKWRKIRHEPRIAGIKISTKFPDGKPFVGEDMEFRRYDVTKEYKHVDDPALAKKAHRKALKLSDKDDLADEKFSNEDVVFIITADREATIGDELIFTIKMTNLSKSGSPLTVRRVDINIFTLTYNNGQRSMIKSQVHFKIQLLNRESVTYKVRVTSDEYIRHIKDLNLMEVEAVAQIWENESVCVQSFSFNLAPIPLTIQAPSVCKLHQPFSVHLSFRNPLRTWLSNCWVSVEGNKFEHTGLVEQWDIKPREEWHCTVKMKAKQRGDGVLFAMFDSEELRDTFATTKISVR